MQPYFLKQKIARIVTETDQCCKIHISFFDVIVDDKKNLTKPSPTIRIL